MRIESVVEFVVGIVIGTDVVGTTNEPPVIGISSVASDYGCCVTTTVVAGSSSLLLSLGGILSPKTCASRTTPILVEQQELDSPQHHRSLSAFPVQGVMRVLFPFVIGSQTSRQGRPRLVASVLSLLKLTRHLVI